MRDALVLSAKQASATKWIPGLFLDDELVRQIEESSKTVTYDVVSMDDVATPDPEEEKDEWADPVSEYLACAAASEAWEVNGLTGFVHPDRLPENWDRFADGNIGYHLRPGTHFLSRHDWVRYCDFIRG